MERNDSHVDFNWPEGASPNLLIPAGTAFSVRWEGKVVPAESGDYSFSAGATGGQARLKINGQLVTDKTPVSLTAGHPVRILLEYDSGGGKGGISLLWMQLGKKDEDPAALVERARKDGTTVLIVDHADSWLDVVKAATKITAAGSFNLGRNWTGGQYFAIDHPLFKGLPVNQALDWPYESVVSQGRSRYGLRIEGEQLVAGCWQSFPMDLGTAVGVVPCGKGRVVLSTLEISPHLHDPPGPADVARKLLCNYIEYAREKAR